MSFVFFSGKVIQHLSCCNPHGEKGSNYYFFVERRACGGGFESRKSRPSQRPFFEILSAVDGQTHSVFLPRPFFFFRSRNKIFLIITNRLGHSSKQQSVKMMRSALHAVRSASRMPPRAVGATRFMSAKDIKFGVDGRAAMLKGVNTLADAVQVSIFGMF